MYNRRANYEGKDLHGLYESSYVHCVGGQHLRTSNLRGCQSHHVGSSYMGYTFGQAAWEIENFFVYTMYMGPSSKLFNMCALIKVESIKPNYIKVLKLYWKINILEAITPFVNGEVLDYPSTQAKHNDGVRGIFAMTTICNIVDN